MFINVKSRGLFAYTFGGQLLWSAGPVLYRFGYRQGCRKNVTDCYFASVPVVDHCEATLYVRRLHMPFYVLYVLFLKLFRLAEVSNNVICIWHTDYTLFFSFLLLFVGFTMPSRVPL